MEGYTIKVYTADELGMTGPNGERFCIFFRNENSIINSGWVWLNSQGETDEIIRMSGKRI